MQTRGLKLYINITIYFFGDFDAKDLHLIWRYKYLEESYESLSKKQKALITKYERMAKPPSYEVEFPLYIKGVNKSLKNLRTLEESLEFVKEEKMEELKFIQEHVPKSQILNQK